MGANPERQALFRENKGHLTEEHFKARRDRWPLERFKPKEYLRAQKTGSHRPEFLEPGPK